MISNISEYLSIHTNTRLEQRFMPYIFPISSMTSSPDMELFIFSLTAVETASFGVCIHRKSSSMNCLLQDLHLNFWNTPLLFFRSPYFFILNVSHLGQVVIKSP